MKKKEDVRVKGRKLHTRALSFSLSHFLSLLLLLFSPSPSHSTLTLASLQSSTQVLLPFYVLAGIVCHCVEELITGDPSARLVAPSLLKMSSVKRPFTQYPHHAAKIRVDIFTPTLLTQGRKVAKDRFLPKSLN